MYKKIILPLDGSLLAERAVEPTIRLGRKTGAAIILLRVPTADVYVPSREFGGAIGVLTAEQAVTRAHDDVTAYLKRVEARFAHAGVTADIEVRDGDPAGEIVDLAVETEADLIVMSTHGRSGMTRWLLGSVAAKVVRHAPCSVYLCRTEKLPEHILVPLDTSTFAEHSLAPTCALAETFGAEVTLLHVDEYGEVYLRDAGLGALVRQAKTSQPLTYLVEMCQAFAEPDAIQVAETKGRAPAKIVDYAAEHDCDFIVMAAHSYTNFERWLIGSTTEKVMRVFHGNMLIVRVPPE